MKDENIDRIEVANITTNTQPRCDTCEYADTHNIVYGTVHCMRNPGSPVAHSSDHVCMQYSDADKR